MVSFDQSSLDVIPIDDPTASLGRIQECSDIGGQRTYRLALRNLSHDLLSTARTIAKSKDSLGACIQLHLRPVANQYGQLLPSVRAREPNARSELNALRCH
jgi:hypothetical protein